MKIFDNVKKIKKKLNTKNKTKLAPDDDQKDSNSQFYVEGTSLILKICQKNLIHIRIFLFFFKAIDETNDDQTDFASLFDSMAPSSVATETSVLGRLVVLAA